MPAFGPTGRRSDHLHINPDVTRLDQQVTTLKLNITALKLNVAAFNPKVTDLDLRPTGRDDLLVVRAHAGMPQHNTTQRLIPSRHPGEGRDPRDRLTRQPPARPQPIPSSQDASLIPLTVS